MMSDRGAGRMPGARGSGARGAGGRGADGGARSRGAGSSSGHSGGREAAGGIDENSKVFAIAVAAELSGMHPQTLRQYDRLGLVSPGRTAGKSRRYSMRDVAKLREVAQLSAEGVSLEGIRRVLELEDRVSELSSRVRELESALADAMLSRPGRRVFAAGAEGDVISVRAGTRVRRNQVVLWRPLGR